MCHERDELVGALMTLRVAVVEDAIGPWSKGGRETRYAALLARVARLGTSVELFTMRWWANEDPPPGEVALVAICPLIPMYSGERRSIWQAVRFALGTPRLLSYDFDVLLADQMPILHLFPLRIVAWVKRVKLVVQWHEVWGVEYWHEYLGAAGRVAASLEWCTARLADHVIAGSEDVRERLAALGVPPERMTVVQNGVDRRRLDALVGGTHDAQLVSVGRLIAHKRVDEAIRTVSRLRERGRPTTLTIIGDGPERRGLEQLAADLGVDADVVFMGTLDSEVDVWAWLRGARVLLFPSDREGFGLVPAESLALGTPVVCVGHPRNDATRLVEEGRTGSVVPPDDLGALVEAVEHWLDASIPPTEVASRFWSAHGDLDWDVSAATLVADLEAVVGDVGAARG